MTKYDVISMGSAVVDAFVYPHFKENDNKIQFVVGEKIRLENINFTVGGGGSNSATSFAKLGFKAGLLTKLGRGYNAKIILRELEKNKIDFLGKQAKEHTGYSIILGTDKGNRTILTFKGTSDTLKFSDIDLKKLNTKWFYFTSMGGESFKSQKKIVAFAREKGIKIGYNPSSFHASRGPEYLKEILRHTDFLSLNKEEAGMLARNGHLYKGLHKLGPKIVCITDGPNKGYVYDGSFLYTYIPNKVRVVDPTGAGDAFGSSFVAGLYKFNDIEEALKLAITNSESLIQKPGAHNGLLSLNEAIKMIKTKKFKIKKELV